MESVANPYKSLVLEVQPEPGTEYFEGTLFGVGPGSPKVRLTVLRCDGVNGVITAMMYRMRNEGLRFISIVQVIPPPRNNAWRYTVFIEDMAQPEQPPKTLTDHKRELLNLKIRLQLHSAHLQLEGKAQTEPMGDELEERLRQLQAMLNLYWPGPDAEIEGS